jgi:hypothetical protein
MGRPVGEEHSQEVLGLAMPPRIPKNLVERGAGQQRDGRAKTRENY